MTGNPRAMEVACTVLDSVTEEVRTNIRERGKQFLQRFQEIANDFPGTIDRVVGTGLMVCAILNPNKYTVLGKGGFEEYLRVNGVEMIHGGDTGLRFTPSFSITAKEVDMIAAVIRQGMIDLKKA
eukprot:TRINITY_DN6872_c0_g2_i1.p2 TRINITY_DN6872_c0_g2~~TRINITY_DN6872_c0_g2_i1.p2  ORF type:complete len:133 (-),score=18.29 TRINITY_DN6872_c0_g2_i1:72-446(-)